MSSTISTLLLRNLHDVFGEMDPLRRRAAIGEIFHEDAVFYDPNGGVYRGHDEIDRVAGEVKATHPDFRYQPLSPPETMGDGGRIRWVEGILASLRHVGLVAAFGLAVEARNLPRWANIRHLFWRSPNGRRTSCTSLIGPSPRARDLETL